MNKLIINGYVIDTDMMTILNTLKKELLNGKLEKIENKGDYIRVTCPHHKGGEEEHPSCSVYCGDSEDIQYGITNCFTCGFSGPLYHFIAECFEKDDEFGKMWIIEHFGNTLVKRELKLEEIDLSNRDNKKIKSDAFLEKYQSWHPYLEKRKLSREVCEKFNVKYDPKRQCIIFPVYTDTGDFSFLVKRSVIEKRFMIDPGSDKLLYCLDRVRKLNIKKCIICEGPIDCLTAWTYGYPAVASLGSLSQKQVDLLNKSGVRTIITMFDNDAAGERFTANFNRWVKKDMIVVNIKLPKGKKDINDLSKEEVDTLLKEYFSDVNI